MASSLFHPLSTFLIGIFCALLILSIFLASCSPANNTAEIVADYEKAKNKASEKGPPPGSAEEREARERFTSFLKNLEKPDYLREHTAQVYAEGAFLDDTIATHHGPAEIQQYFLQTAETMTEFKLSIDDIARSGPDHYFRWTMIFAAPKLGGGKPIHSVGMSQVRFNQEGKIAFHQDFWDSGKNIYGQISFVGGIIQTIRNRMK